MGRIRLSTVVSAATVLLIAWLASRTRLDVGIAVGVGGLLLAYARPAVAVPVVAVAAAVACVTALAAKVALVVLAVAVVLGGLGVVVHLVVASGGMPQSGSAAGADPGWGVGGDWGGGGGGDCGSS